MENKPGLYSARERDMGQEVVGRGNNGSADESSREFGCGRQSPGRLRPAVPARPYNTRHLVPTPSIYQSLSGKFKCYTRLLIHYFLKY